MSSIPMIDLPAAIEVVLQKESLALAGLYLNRALVLRISSLCYAINDCSGRVIATGVGKAGIIGQKFASTCSSTGTPALFLSPTDAMHGDLGIVDPDDLVVVFTNSGDTQEIVRLLPHIRKIGAQIWAITGRSQSPTGDLCDGLVNYGSIAEAGDLGLAPTCSTLVMLAIGDAIALSCQKLRGFSGEDYARFHPAGALAGKAVRVEDVMRKKFVVVRKEEWVRTALEHMTDSGCGLASVIDDDMKLVGVFTDGDFRRMHESDTKIPIEMKMTARPHSIKESAFVADAMKYMREFKINAMPVVDQDNEVVGLLDIQDLIGLRLEL